MKLILGLFFLMIPAVSICRAQVDQCFENKGLKELHTVSYTLTGNRLEGTFEVSNGDGTTSAETFEFTGTKSGNLLTIKFRGTIPYELPPRARKIVWTLGKTVLKIPRYGKNYETNRFAVYTADYERCGEI
jgi:hypothetical protein